MHPSRGRLRAGTAAAVDVALVLIIAAGVVARLIELPHYVPDSGDEWGNTIAPLRVLFERGDPGTFFHPSLYYGVTAGVYAVLFGVLKAFGVTPAAMSMPDLFVVDERYFVFAARAVSVAGAILAIGAAYAFGRWLWDRTSGLIAAALLAVYPTHALYSEAVRVDSVFLALFLYAFLQIARIVRNDGEAPYARAGFFTGLATGANYNGAILAPWLLLAHWLNGVRRDAGTGRLARAAAWAIAAFAVSSPFVLLDPRRAGKYLAFLAGLSLADHPGMEGRGAFFYATDLAAANPFAAAAIAAAALAIVVAGTRTERFVLSLPVAYVVLFSLMRTKFDRFILPAMALLLVATAGLPAMLARRWPTAPVGRVLGPAAAWLLLVASLAAWAPRAIPIPRNEMLARADGPVFEWIEQHVPPRSRIVVEPGLLPLVDTFDAPGAFTDELRRSMVRMRPGLDHDFMLAKYLGEQTNYDFAGVVQRADYAIVSPRNVEYIRGRCDAYAEVCTFYRDLGKQGRLVFRAPPGYELALVYELHPD